MNPLMRSAGVCFIQIVFLLGVAGKFAYDRATLPRRWIPVHPVDPDALLRGRYLVLEPDGQSSQRFEYFVPEHADLKPGEGQRLWAEVSDAPNGPRAIRVELRPR